LKRFVPFIIVAAVALTTIAVGTALYRANRPPPLTISKEKRVTDEKTESMHIRGPADATVTLEEFGDFQCPPCGALSEPLNELERDYKAKMRFVFHQFPLVNHANAKPAAYAAEAAGLQGRFWEMHDLLYRE
jgi:protein-disulfide isomerase